MNDVGFTCCFPDHGRKLMKLGHRRLNVCCQVTADEIDQSAFSSFAELSGFQKPRLLPHAPTPAAGIAAKLEVSSCRVTRSKHKCFA